MNIKASKWPRYRNFTKAETRRANRGRAKDKGKAHRVYAVEGSIHAPTRPCP